MKVLLVEPRRPKSWGKNNQHIGLLRLASYHKAIGDDVEYVVAPDLPVMKPDLVCVTSMFTYDYKEVWDACRHYRQWLPWAKIVLGGIYATLCPEHAAMAGADEVCVGQHLLARDYPPDPSVLPYKQGFAYLFTSWGCDRACTYCATHLLYGKGIRQLEPERVVGEIRHVLSKGFREVLLGDDNLLYRAPDHIDEICREIIRQKLKVTLRVPGGMTASQFTPTTARLMREAGFREISFAIESVSAEVRRKMGRAGHVDEAALLQALAYADEAGFTRNETNVYFIIGLPYQGLEDMMGTLMFLIGTGVWAHPQRFTPIPGTAEWKRLGLEGVDFGSLYYKHFVAPGADFTGDELDEIYRIARFFNIGNRYTGNQAAWLNGGSRVSRLFRGQLRTTWDALGRP